MEDDEQGLVEDLRETVIDAEVLRRAERAQQLGVGVEHLARATVEDVGGRVLDIVAGRHHAAGNEFGALRTHPLRTLARLFR